MPHFLLAMADIKYLTDHVVLSKAFDKVYILKKKNKIVDESWGTAGQTFHLVELLLKGILMESHSSSQGPGVKDYSTVEVNPWPATVSLSPATN